METTETTTTQHETTGAPPPATPAETAAAATDDAGAEETATAAASEATADDPADATPPAPETPPTPETATPAPAPKTGGKGRDKNPHAERAGELERRDAERPAEQRNTITFGAYFGKVAFGSKLPAITFDADLSPEQVAKLYKARKSGRVEITLTILQEELPFKASPAKDAKTEPVMCTCGHRLETHAGADHKGKCLSPESAGVGKGPCKCKRFEEQPRLPIEKTNTAKAKTPTPIDTARKARETTGGGKRVATPAKTPPKRAPKSNAPRKRR